VVTNARPEIADYPFTTLTPNLGVADIDDGSLLIADIPGLIEGAADGKGLGDQFLRHVDRSAVLLHLIDAYSNDIAADYKTIRDELKRYSEELIERREVVALTKTEGLDSDIVEMQADAVRKVAGKDTTVLTISSTAHKGLTEVLRLLRQKVESARAEARAIAEAEDISSADGVPVISLNSQSLSEAWTVTKEDNVYIVRGDKIEKFARRTNFDQFDGVNRLRDILKKMGIAHELSRQGASGESVIRIGGDEFTLLEQQ
jgi:GTP-binding protein